MAFQNIVVEVSERICTITFNRPERLNALDLATLRELRTALEEAAAREDVGVVLLTGAGTKAFVAGGDLAQMKGFTALQALDYAQTGQGVLALIEELPKPVIGVLNGFALGGGCEVAMACDLLVASDTAKLGQPEVGLGLIPGFGGTQRLPRLVGRNVAKELVLTGDLISAQRAWEIGLVNRVVPGAALVATARELAKKLLSRGPAALRLAKLAMNRGLEVDLTTGCALEASLFAAGFSTADRDEGIGAFLEKRPAVFTGR
jgi:enoyl-CoA hydratase